MRSRVGVDLGAEKKGFDISLINESRPPILAGRLDVRKVVDAPAA